MAEQAPEGASAIASPSSAEPPQISGATSKSKAKAKTRPVMTATMKRRALKPKPAKTDLLQAKQDTPQS
jgi:hypothetical protein